jgi:serine protease Do
MSRRVGCMTTISAYFDRSRGPVSSMLLALLLLGGRWLSGTATAQYVIEAPTPQERAKQYNDLAAEVEHLEQQAMALRKVAHFVKPTVVHIDAERIDSFNTRGKRVATVEDAGSGTIVEYKGKYYILTNRHVVKSAASMRTIKIKLADGRTITPSAVWSDPATDIAIMAVTADGLVPAKVGDSDKLDVGDFVLAVGSPFGLSHSVTFGIVSAKGRRKLDLGEGVEFQDFIQTDAAINPGNSGGPLMNLRGELIGMNAAIASNSGGSEGIGFTIPVNMAMVVARQLIEHGAVSRAYLGVTLDSKFTQTAASKLGLSRPIGARVVGITDNSPAQVAKLQVDDVILEINNVQIDDDNHLVSMVALTEVGKELPLLIYRNGEPVRLSVKVSSRNKFEKARPVSTRGTGE